MQVNSENKKMKTMKQDQEKEVKIDFLLTTNYKKKIGRDRHQNRTLRRLKEVGATKKVKKKTYE